jgi:hypothetical protein
MFETTPSIFFEGVEVFPQLYKALTEYPFPSDFYRPSRYPYIEYYTGNQRILYMHANDAFTISDTEQKYPLN